jgi:hypothetical protein
MCPNAAPMLSSSNIVSIGSCGLGDVEFATVFSHNLCHGAQAEANRRLRRAALSCRLSDCKSAGRRQSIHPIENSTQTPRCDTSGEQAPQGRI